MLALDASAIVAVLLLEAEEADFRRAIAASGALVGTPTLVETRLVPESHLSGRAGSALQAFLHGTGFVIVPFDAAMFEAASDAFVRFGKDRHPAKLNVGDCLSYAVAETHALSPLFKGNDFVHTDIVPAYTPAP